MPCASISGLTRRPGCCAGEVAVDRGGREVTLSMIFKWYAGDFGPPEVLLPWLVQVRTRGPH